MHWTAFLAYRRFPAHARVADDLPCAGCGYNLRSALVNGQCPECGKPVGDSLFVLNQPEVVGHTLRTIGGTYLGFLALFIMALPVSGNWPFIVAFAVMGFMGIIRAIAVSELRVRGAIESLPIVSTRLRLLLVIVVADAILACATCVLGFIASKFSAPPGSPVFAMMIAATLGWVVVHLLGALVAGWLGSAFATMLWYTFARWEFVIQRVGLGLGAVLVSLAFLAAANSPANRWVTASLFVIAFLPITIAMALTAAGLAHVGSGAMTERDTWEDIIDVDPAGEYSGPLDTHKPEPPAIKME